MTKLEAQLSAITGSKVAHISFTSDEYVEYSPSIGFLFEDGVIVPLHWWNGPLLGDDWFIYKEQL